MRDLQTEKIQVYVMPITKKRIRKRKAVEGFVSDSDYVRSLILKDVRIK